MQWVASLENTWGVLMSIMGSSLGSMRGGFGSVGGGFGRTMSSMGCGFGGTMGSMRGMDGNMNAMGGMRCDMDGINIKHDNEEKKLVMSMKPMLEAMMRRKKGRLTMKFERPCIFTMFMCTFVCVGNALYLYFSFEFNMRI